MDETSVAFFMGHKAGNVMDPPIIKKERRPEPVQHCTRGDRRTNITHVAVFSPEPDIQAILPQLILGNEHILRLRDMDRIRDECMANVHVDRENSGWMNAQKMKRFFSLLVTAIRNVCPKFQIILYMDCAKQHMGPEVIASARAYNIWLCFIPAKLTWLMQPADTHAFARYKSCLVRQMLQLRQQEEGGVLSVPHWVKAINLTIRKVMQGVNWSHAFAENGMMSSQTHVSKFIRSHLHETACLDIPATRPDNESILRTFPARTKMNINLLFRGPIPQLLPPPLPPPPLPPPPLAIHDQESIRTAPTVSGPYREGGSSGSSSAAAVAFAVPARNVASWSQPPRPPKRRLHLVWGDPNRRLVLSEQQQRLQEMQHGPISRRTRSQTSGLRASSSETQPRE